MASGSQLAPWERPGSDQFSSPPSPVKPVRVACEFSIPGRHVWCGSIVENPSGTFSLFFSTWPVEHGHEGWVTHSEIWRAEGRTPLGPFCNPHPVFARTATPSWDSDNFHNVTVRRFAGRYFLYYTGNFGNGEWWIHRNNQRIGVAVAEGPEGPWRRFSSPVLDVSASSWDSLCVANPTVARTPDGRFLMIYKGVTSGDLPYGSRVLHGAAVAGSPEGPFQKVDGSLFDIPGKLFAFEDPHLWFQNGTFHCLMKDMVGLEGSCRGATVLFVSENGTRWPIDRYRLIATPHLERENGEVVSVEKLERASFFSHPECNVLSFAVKPMGDLPSHLVFATAALVDDPSPEELSDRKLHF